MNIKLLCLDLDDTLLREDLSISPEDLRSLRAAEDLGVQVVLASGRVPEAMARYVKELGMDRKEGFLVSYNGGQILRADTGEIEWAASLPVSVSRAVYQTCRDLKIPLQCYREGIILVTQDNYYSEVDTQLTGMPRRVVDEEEFFSTEPVKLVIPMEPKSLKVLAHQLQNQFKGLANMYISKPYYFEILPLEADKGLALAKIALTHKIPQDQVLAMGDAMNDEGMLRWAGTSVAPSNARGEIRELVDWVTTRSHNDGAVTEMIHRYILGAS